MKKVIIIACGLIQAVIISMAELVTCTMLVNCVADKTGYYGLWNIPLFLIVAGCVMGTFVVCIRYMEKCARND